MGNPFLYLLCEYAWEWVLHLAIIKPELPKCVCRVHISLTDIFLNSHDLYLTLLMTTRKMEQSVLSFIIQMHFQSIYKLF